MERVQLTLPGTDVWTHKDGPRSPSQSYGAAVGDIDDAPARAAVTNGLYEGCLVEVRTRGTVTDLGHKYARVETEWSKAPYAFNLHELTPIGDAAAGPGREPDTNDGPVGSELRAMADRCPGQVAALLAQLRAIHQEMDRLELLGLCEASPVWRPDKEGKPRYLTLVYPTQPDGTRRRVYIGCGHQVVPVLDSCHRYKEHRRLDREYDDLAGRVLVARDWLRHFKRLVSD